MRAATMLTMLLLAAMASMAQPVPTEEENIPYLVTFGNESETSWGDDDFSQCFFFVVPENNQVPVYIRVYDPDCGGSVDERKGKFDSQTVFSVYGGQGCISDKDATHHNPTGNFRSGTLLAKKSFGPDSDYDGLWYTFGPFNPSSGEHAPEYGGYIFKVIAEGKNGNDGNLYRYFLSSQANSNEPVEGGNAFTFEYSFRLNDDPDEVSHIFPFIDDKVISVQQHNFDWDDDGSIRIISVVKKGEFLQVSGDDSWQQSEHSISAAEQNTTLDIRFIKAPEKGIKNNNVVFYMLNQYGEYLPFYTAPIGGIPSYKASISARKR